MSTADISQASDLPGGFPPGVLVSARGRDWVVFARCSVNMVMVRPLGGIDEKVTGIRLDFE